MINPKAIVEAGYDAIAGRYVEWCGLVVGDPRLRFLDALTTRLPARSSVLELGCGAGIPCTQRLAVEHEVLGVDLSATQISLARQNVPGARFRQCDMTGLTFSPGTFDAVTAFYSVLHVPRDRQGKLFLDIASWLRPGGLFLAALGSGTTDGPVDDWLGTPMYFSSHPPSTNRELLAAAGFTLLVDELVTMQEPEGSATFHWVITQTATERTMQEQID